MKYFLVGTIALFAFASVNAARAADVAVKAPPAPVASAYSWTGFYVGANGGYGWGDPTVSFSPNDLVAASLFDGTLGGTSPGPTSFSKSGGLGGLQAGYNWQVDPKWVLGLETDFDWSGIKGNGTSNFSVYPLAVFPGGPSNIQANQNIDWFGTVRARVGLLPTNNALIYGTAGFAYGHTTERLSLNTANLTAAGNGVFGFTCDTGVNCFVGSSSHTETGWTAGAGFEYAPWNNNVTLRAEYLYISLSGNTVNIVASDPGIDPKRSSITAGYSRTDFNVVRAGLNYKFN
jgi:outer membrane immunogenic protein